VGYREAMAPVPGQATAVDDATLVSWLSRFRRWDDWGERRDLGTLNFITPSVRRVAAAEVHEGIGFGCGRPISPSDGRVDNPISHHMLASGDDLPVGAMGSTADVLTVSWHGRAVTHVDAHSHIAWDRHLYGGAPVERVTARHGAMTGSVEVAGDGIVGRGVLCDVGRFCAARGEPPPAAVGLDLLRAVARDQDVTLGTGDILLVRFGARGGAADPDGSPGLAPDCLPWLYETEVAALGTDEVADPLPVRPGVMPMPVHTVGIVAMGLWIMDNLDLDAVADACALRGRWTFLLSVAPLRIRRATGSPVNPIALL
jgi:kynurenine formamidase